MHAAASREQFRQLAGRFVTQRNKVKRLAPGSRFLGALCRHHLADDRRQQSRRMLPADQVEALERLVDEVERVSGVGEAAIRGHVFCSFLALVLRKELDERCRRAEFRPEWGDVLRDLDRLQEIEISSDGRQIVLRTPATGVIGPGWRWRAGNSAHQR
jgi:hypothetical protein